MRSNTLTLLFWLGLVLVSIRPVAPVERACAWLFAPLRGLAELGAPLRWVRAAEIRRTDDRLAEEARHRLGARRALLEDLASFAEPTGALREGRRLVPGAVVGRSPESRDRILVRLPPGERVRRGYPVVCGDAYVGRVRRLVEPSACEVDLVTGRSFHVGAVRAGRAEAAVQMTVGGLDPGSGRRGGRELLLAVHNPSDREVRPGPVVVSELLVGRDPLGADGDYGLLASGFQLGELLQTESGWALAPVLDFEGGLFQVTVLAPDEGGPPVPRPAEELSDGNWSRARPLTSGDPSPWRRGLVLAVGSRAGVSEGAALASGLRLLGRVTRVGPWSAGASLLDDPGLRLVLVARVEGLREPQALGRLRSAGREPESSALRFDWDPVVPLEVDGRSEGSVRAELYTGSGEEGLPGGLYVGSAELPLGPPPPGASHRVLVEAPPDPASVGDLWVRTGRGARP